MTISSDSGPILLVAAVAAAAVAGALTAWRRRIPGLALGPSLRVTGYLARYATALEYYGLRRGEIRALVDALRGDLASVAADGVDDALGRLGPPRTLAAEMASGTMRPSLLRGALWFAAAILVAVVVGIAMTEAFLGGFEPVAQPGDQAGWSGIGFGVDATMGAHGRASDIEFGGWGLMFVPVFAFAVGARLWRLVSRSSNG
ncbi:MAG: hypothetical protein ACK5OX_07315 [Desertimonas sp.]